MEEQANRQFIKATKGQSKGIPEWNTNVKVYVQFNGVNFQPVGERAGKLKSQLGQIVRNGHRVPLNIIDWKKVGDDVKERIWEEVKVCVNHFHILSFTCVNLLPKLMLS